MAIALALEFKGSILIIDGYKARKFAEQLGLTITGTLGVIIRAKQKGIIDSVLSIVERLKSSGFGISVELENEIKELSKE